MESSTLPATLPATIRILRPEEPHVRDFSRPAGRGSVVTSDFEAIGAWIRWLTAQDLAESTIRLYAYGVCRLFIDQVRGSIETVTEEHITAFLAGLSGRATCRVQYFRGIRSFFRYAAARGLVGYDPSPGLRVRKPRRPPPVALSEEELFRMLMAAYGRSPRRAWALMLTFSIGARRMEVAAIRPEDVQGDVVHIRTAKYHKQRRVELGPLARVALEELRPWYNGTVLGGVAKETITRWAHQAAQDAGLLPKVHGRVAHVLRSSFATHLLRKGVPVNIVRDLLGHENVSTTSFYLAVEPAERRQAVEGNL
jgi:integrase/recombinase XerD